MTDTPGPSSTLDDTVRQYVSSYVWNIATDMEKRSQMVEILNAGQPYLQEDYLAVAMIDIAGYSSLVSELSVAGKIASEVITSTVNDFFRKIIAVIYDFSGDIVKFLGDAMLVGFGPKRPEEDRRFIVERATMCCLNILQNYSEIRISLDNQPFDLTGDQADIPSLPIPSQFKSHDSADNDHTLCLGIHVALVSGDVTRMICGVPSLRLDYSLTGTCFQHLAPILDGTRKGQFGLDKDVWSSLRGKMKAVLEDIAVPYTDDGGKDIVSSRIEYMMFEKANLLQLADVINTYNPARSNYEELGYIDSINHIPGSSQDEMQMSLATPSSALISSTSNEPEYLMKPSPTDTFIKGECADSEAILIASKFVNKSLLHRVFSNPIPATIQTSCEAVEDKAIKATATSAGQNSITKLDSSTDDVNQFKAEFRKVTTVFAKLPNEMDNMTAGMVCTEFMRAVDIWKGSFQQFAADDKGRTLFAVFGLPPLTFDKDPVHALKASISFIERLERKRIKKIAISIASGQLLYSRLGSPNRFEASLLGDVVNLCARLLSISVKQERIVCDQITFDAGKLDVSLEELGRFTVKGKIEPVNVFAVDWAKAKSGKTGVAGKVFNSVGYFKEKGRMMEAYMCWKTEHKKMIVVCEGASGMGKSNLVSFCLEFLAKDGITCCLTQASEIERWSPMFALFNSFTTIMKVFRAYKNIPGDVQHASSKATLSSGIGKGAVSNPKTYISRGSFSSRFSLGGGQLQTNNEIHAMQELLAAVDESRNLYPILSALQPSKMMHDTDLTRDMVDHRARMTTLKRILVKVFQFMTTVTPMVFIFDDSQWFDPVSMELLLQVTEECSNICILFFTRSIADIEVDYLARIARLPDCVNLQLNGLGKSSTEKLIVQKLQSENVKSVESTFLEKVHEISNGHPLQIDMLVGAICSDVYKSALKVTESGQLQATDMSDIMTKISFISKAGPAIVQFDRLDTDFQDFLKKASICGQYFHLSDMEALGLEVENVELFYDWIETKDQYNFLRAHQDSPEQHTGSFMFNHISVMLAIYESQPFEQRVKHHLKLAEYFEREVNVLNEESLLPTIAFHYSRTPLVAKNVRYMETLAFLNFRKCYYREAQQNLECLLNYIETANMASLSDVDRLSINDPVRKADLMAHKAYVLMVQRRPERVISLCIKALGLAGIPFSTEEKVLKKALLKAVFKLFVLWRRTKGGTIIYEEKGIKSQYLAAGIQDHYRPEQCSEHCHDCPKKRRIQSICYRAMVLAGIVTSDLPQTAFALLVLETCNADIKTGAIDQGEWAVSCGRAAYGTYLKFPWASALFRKMAASAESNRNLGDKAHEVHHLIAFILFASGTTSFDEMYEFVNRGIEFHTKRGDLATAIAMKGVKETIPFWAGDLQQPLDIAADVMDQFKLNPVWTTFNVSMALRTYQVRGDISKTKELTAQLQSYIEALPKIPSFQGYPLIFHMPKSWLAIQEGRIEDAIASYNEFARYFEYVNAFGNIPLEMMIFGGVLTWMLISSSDKYFQNCIQGGENQYTFNADRLVDSCKSLLAQAKSYSKKARVVHTHWASCLYNSALVFIAGKPLKAILALIREVQKQKNVQQLNQYVMTKALVYSIIGKFHPQRKLARPYFKEALDLYTSFGAVYMAQWMSLSAV
ncbi:hypothetical protein HDV05_002133 [Chytridiales sp. JEL 0842]|nr:hypothetical protein HDV05_002133 [Chytridiales sp. JEL 0842]